MLGLSVTKFLFNIEDGLSPGVLSELRSELVNNQFLGVVGILLGLPKLMHHQVPHLNQLIESWTLRVKTAMQKNSNDAKITEEDQEEVFKPPFWKEMDIIPKMMGDLYESILGAIFLDSHFSFEIVEAAVTRTLLQNWWPVFLPTLKHLKETLKNQ